MKLYGKFWKLIFEYKGKSTSKEFRAGFIPTMLLAVLTCCGMFCSFLAQQHQIEWFWQVETIRGISWILLFLTVLHMIPFLALTVRTLRGKQKNVWLSLLVLVIGIGWILLAVACLEPYGRFFPQNNVAAGVYGPPEWFEPSLNENVDVYGPPPFEMEEESIEEESEDAYELDTSVEEFDASLNIQPCVYGPPEMFDEEPEEE